MTAARGLLHRTRPLGLSRIGLCVADLAQFVCCAVSVASAKLPVPDESLLTVWRTEALCSAGSTACIHWGEKVPRLASIAHILALLHGHHLRTC